MHLSVLQFLPLPKRVPARKPVWASCNSISLQISCRQHQGFEYHVILSSSKPRMIVDVSIIVFEHHAILLPYSAAALFRCLRTLQFHTFSILKSIGTSKKSGLNPCNFTSAKPTVQHSEHLFEFEYHAISYTPKPNLCVARDTVVFEPYAISFFHWLTMPSLFERHAISSASKTIRRG